MRQIILDTETTGLSPTTGDRIIEIGAIELINRKLTGKYLHFYLNPDRVIAQEAIKIHGLSNEFLIDKPRFFEVVAELMNFITGAELVIHNAEFDINFLNYELSLLRRNTYNTIHDHCQVIDTLALARQLHPGQRNSLDALCKRYNIKNSHRTLHGALLDAEILANVFLAMTGGQEQLFASEAQTEKETEITISTQAFSEHSLKVVYATEVECLAHTQYFSKKNKLA
jgi:DNA polymerase-3 subunit epsilon